MSDTDLRLAREYPRDEDNSERRMRSSCGRLAMAERAFWSVVRDGEVVTGPSVVLARELARCWGNVQHGVREVSHRPDAGEVEVEAWAWDLESNTRASFEFVVRFAGRNATDMVAAQGARRLREAIWQVLPRWFTEDAITAAHQSLVDGDGRPLEDRCADVCDAWGELGVSVDQLVELMHRDLADWTPLDVATLHVRALSVQRGEVTLAEVFSGQQQISGSTGGRVTAAEILANAGGHGVPAAPGDDLAASPPPATSEGPGSDGASGPSAFDRAKVLKRQFSRAGRNAELTAALRAEGLPATAASWTDDQAHRVIEIAEGLS